MAILVDQPRWPAHGTVFGHLVSDSSLDELHAFADRAGLSPRAFDHDHYDVPEERYPQLIALGATEVASAELLKRLVRAGLRVRTRDRTPKRPAAQRLVAASWQALLPGTPGLLGDLLGRWGEPHRRYHDVRHLAQCLTALGQLGAGPASHRPVLLAAWFHDAVHNGQPGRDEQASAALAARELDRWLPAAEVAEVVRLVLLTIGHDPEPDDTAWALLVDADLSVLGQNRGRYHVYLRDIRAEYLQYSDADFTAGRLAVVRGLLDRPTLFHTERGRELWLDAARRNLSEEATRLQPVG